MKLYYLLFYIIVSIQLPALGQKDSTGSLDSSLDLSKDFRVNWLKKNAVVIRTVTPTDDSFNDLQPLKEIIGSSRMVMLGETCHGDGTSFLAKSRLVKFLHQEMGFDILVFESGFYDMSKVNELITKGTDPEIAMQQGLFQVWSRSPQVKDLMEYIGKSHLQKNPITVEGFDMQMAGGFSKKTLLKELDSLSALYHIESDLVLKDSKPRVIAENLLAYKYYRGTPFPDSTEKEIFYQCINDLQQKFQNTGTMNPLVKESWIIHLSNMKGGAELSWSRNSTSKWNSFNVRDEQNATNLLWLADNKYAGKKIMVWGATMHFVKNPSLIDTRDSSYSYNGIATVGDILWKKLKEQLYIIGFTCYEGNVGIGEPNDPQGFHETIVEDQDPSVELEELLNATKYDYALVNFRSKSKGNEWLHTPIISRPLANLGMKADWTQIMDAMFYIRVMEPNGATQPK